MDTFYVNIAGFLCELQFKQTACAGFTTPPEPYLPFRVKPKEVLPADERLFVMQVDSTLTFPEDGELIGEFSETGPVNTVHLLPDGSYRFTLADIRGQQVYTMLVDAGFRHVQLALSGNLAQHQLGFNNAMMIAYAFAAAPHGVLLMHSSVVTDNRRACMFLGKSGTGKSTHSRQWLETFDDMHLMNDDNPVMRVIGDQVFVYGSPWSGKTPCYRNESAPVAGLVMLVQHPFNAMRPLTVVEGLKAMMMSCASMCWDKRSYHAICDTMANVVRHARLFQLECLPDHDAARLSRQNLLGE